MKLNNIFKFLFVAGIALTLSSCSINQSAMSSASTQVQIRPFDLDLTAPTSTTESFTYILGVDWGRLFSFNYYGGNFSKKGIIASLGVPVVGADYLSADQAMALKKLIDENSGMNYDMIMYPRFERKTKWLPFFTKSETTVTARFAKLKN